MRHPILDAPVRAWLARSAVGCAVLAAGLSAATGQAAAAAPVTAKVKADALTVTGTAGDDKLALRLAGAESSTLIVDVGDDGSADFSFERDRFARIAVQGGDGNDGVRIDESGGVFTDTEQTTLDGEAGDDTLTGGAGAETLLGGDGSDAVDPRRGNDLALLGGGDDRAVWNPGDGSDTIEGQADRDILKFNGSGVGEIFDLAANGTRLRLLRNIGNVTMDTDGVEAVDLAMLAGADTVMVHDLGGTALDTVNTSLAAVLGGPAGDAQNDTIVVEGTNGEDVIRAFGGDGAATVSGLHATVKITGAEPARDTLAIKALLGDDVVAAHNLAATAVQLVTDGGTGDDVLIGSHGNDVVDPDRGNDFALLGAGNDQAVWNPGDGSDTIEGQTGTDTLTVTGSGVAERIDLSGNGGRLRFLRDVGAVTLDADDVESVKYAALGGADIVTVNDLSATDVTDVDTDLAGAPGGSAGDTAGDRVIVNGTPANNAFRVTGATGTVNVTGLAASVGITHAEAANDTLTVNGLGGLDTIDATGLAPNTIALRFFQ